MKRKISFLFYLLISLFFISLNSCFDDKYDLTKVSPDIVYDPKLALSIGSTTIRLNELFNSLDSSKYIHHTDSGLLYVIYDQNIKAISAEFQIPLPPQTPVNIPSVAMLPTFPFSGFVCVPTSISMNIPVSFKGDQIIDSIVLKNFIIKISGNSTYQQDGNLVLTFSTITNKKGEPLSDTIPIPGKSIKINFLTPNKPGYTMGFNPGTANLPIDVTFTLCGNAGETISGDLNLMLKIDSLNFFALYGYLGQDTLLNASDSLDISFLNHSLAKNIQWKDPQLTFNILNSYGLPVEFDILSMKVNSIINNSIYPVKFFNNSDKNDILAASKSVPVTNNTLKFQNSTTDFFSYLEKAPNSIKFNLFAKSNPSGNTGSKNVIFDNSIIDTKMQLYLPIWFKAQNFGTIDTIAFPLSDFLNQKGNNNSIESMLFRIISENTLPVDINLQIVFADSTYKGLDSLYKTGSKTIVIGGQIGTSGIITGPTANKTDITLNSSNTKQLDALKKTKYLLIKMNLTTSDYNKGLYAKFFTDYYLKLSFACQFQPKIQITSK